METTWYVILAAMLAVYVVLDGFDFGAGILHLFVAKEERERREVAAAIGPVWDGNEVWLLASGGVLFLAFPRAFAAGFSGFYLPLMMVLWLLIVRGLALEFRAHHANPLWRSFADAALALASTLMAVLLGAALGNIIRGVPLDDSGYFTMPLFNNLQPSATPGIVDWYTLIVGVFALVVLAAHGALYLVWKTEGKVHDRSLDLAPWLWAMVGLLFMTLTVATAAVQPQLFAAIRGRPWSWPLVAVACGGFTGVVLALRGRRERAAFFSSAAFIAGLLASTAAGLYPHLLTSTYSPSFSLTAHNAATASHGLRVAFVWWLIGVPLALSYALYLFRSFRGKVNLDEQDHY